MKVLVVFYSRTGNTRKIAHAIANNLGAEIEEIVDRVDRRGVIGYLRSASGGWFGRKVAIDRPTHDATSFDLVIVGTPIWRWSVSTPVRGYLEMSSSKLRRVAFFCTMGGSGDARAFRQMQDLCAMRPVAIMAVRDAFVKQNRFDEAVDAFAAQVRSALAKV